MNQDPHGHGATPGQGAYGIDDVLVLMKQIPADGLNERLVVDVVRKTLESTGISISAILEMAGQYQAQIENEIMRIQGEIATLHQAIEEKSAQVSALQEQLSEIGQLQERFQP